jgi:ribonuclease P/MRP protein subunit POP1
MLSILRMALRPPPADKTPDLKHMHDQVMRGVCYENAMVWTCSPQTVWVKEISKH